MTAKNLPSNQVTVNPCVEKPRTIGLTEVKGPYYSTMGKRYLLDMLTNMGHCIDSVQFSGGTFTVLHPSVMHEIIELAHEYDVLVSTGGFMQYALTHYSNDMKHEVLACKKAGFDILSVYGGKNKLDVDDILRLISMANNIGLKARPQIDIHPTDKVSEIVSTARAASKAGADKILVSLKDMSVSTSSCTINILDHLADAIGIDMLMLDATEPHSAAAYINTFGKEVNLFADHSELVQVESIRRGLWRTQGDIGTWARA